MIAWLLEVEFQFLNLSWRQAMRRACKIFLSDDSGATAIEYALLTSFLAIAIIGGLTALGTRLSQEFSEVSAALK
jgi:pilus assembly protein Flp/PilA